MVNAALGEQELRPERRKRGTRPKGDRAAISTRVPADHKPHYEELARLAGMGLSDWVAVQLAEATGLGRPGWIARPTNQPTIPGIEEGDRQSAESDAA